MSFYSTSGCLRLLRPGLVLLVSLALAPGVFAQSGAATEPTGAVKSAVEGVLAAVRADPHASGGDVDAISVLVEQKFLPYTDFERTTRLAVGESIWTAATPAQQHALFAAFQTLLVRTYATELTQIVGTNVKFQYQPVQGSGSNVVVPTHLASNGDDNQIDYRVEKSDKGYRIYDIRILGAWLSVLYRGQFATQLEHGGIDNLIKSLEAHNAR